MQTQQATTDPNQLALDLQDQSRKELRRENWKRLNKILGFTAPLDGLICAITGETTLDVVKLDARLQTPDGVSLADHLTRQYGQEAHDLVESLI